MPFLTSEEANNWLGRIYPEIIDLVKDEDARQVTEKTGDERLRHLTETLLPALAKKPEWVSPHRSPTYAHSSFATKEAYLKRVNADVKDYQSGKSAASSPSKKTNTSWRQKFLNFFFLANVSLIILELAWCAVQVFTGIPLDLGALGAFLKPLTASFSADPLGWLQQAWMPATLIGAQMSLTGLLGYAIRNNFYKMPVIGPIFEFFDNLIARSRFATWIVNTILLGALATLTFFACPPLTLGVVSLWVRMSINTAKKVPLVISSPLPITKGNTDKVEDIKEEKEIENSLRDQSIAALIATICSEKTQPNKIPSITGPEAKEIRNRLLSLDVQVANKAVYDLAYQTAEGYGVEKTKWIVAFLTAEPNTQQFVGVIMHANETADSQQAKNIKFLVDAIQAADQDKMISLFEERDSKLSDNEKLNIARNLGAILNKLDPNTKREKILRIQTLIYKTAKFLEDQRQENTDLYKACNFVSLAGLVLNHLLVKDSLRAPDQDFKSLQKLLGGTTKTDFIKIQDLTVVHRKVFFNGLLNLADEKLLKGNDSAKKKLVKALFVNTSDKDQKNMAELVLEKYNEANRSLAQGESASSNRSLYCQGFQILAKIITSSETPVIVSSTTSSDSSIEYNLSNEAFNIWNTIAGIEINNTPEAKEQKASSVVATLPTSYNPSEIKGILASKSMGSLVNSNVPAMDEAKMPLSPAIPSAHREMNPPPMSSSNAPSLEHPKRLSISKEFRSKSSHTLPFFNRSRGKNLAGSQSVPVTPISSVSFNGSNFNPEAKGMSSYSPVGDPNYRPVLNVSSTPRSPSYNNGLPVSFEEKNKNIVDNLLQQGAEGTNRSAAILDLQTRIKGRTTGEQPHSENAFRALIECVKNTNLNDEKEIKKLQLAVEVCVGALDNEAKSEPAEQTRTHIAKKLIEEFSGDLKKGTDFKWFATQLCRRLTHKNKSELQEISINANSSILAMWESLTGLPAEELYWNKAAIAEKLNIILAKQSEDEIGLIQERILNNIRLPGSKSATILFLAAIACEVNIVSGKANLIANLFISTDKGKEIAEHVKGLIKINRWAESNLKALARVICHHGTGSLDTDTLAIWQKIVVPASQTDAKLANALSSDPRSTTNSTSTLSLQPAAIESSNSTVIPTTTGIDEQKENKIAGAVQEVIPASSSEFERRLSTSGLSLSIAGIPRIQPDLNVFDNPTITSSSATVFSPTPSPKAHSMASEPRAHSMASPPIHSSSSDVAHSPDSPEIQGYTPGSYGNTPIREVPFQSPSRS